MTEISTSFNLGGLPYGNHFNFGCDIKAYIERFPVVSERFGYLTAPYIQALQAEDEAIKQITWSDLTEPIRQQDDIRDRALETFKDILRGYERIAPQPQMMQDAQKVIRYVKHNDVNPNAQYDRETGMMTNLIQDLEAHCMDEIRRLHLDAILEQMKTANNEVFRLLLERDVEYGERKKEAVAKARREVDRLYLALRNSVNAFAMVDPEGIFTPFINSVNATIKRLNEQVFKIPQSGSTSTTNPDTGNGSGNGSGDSGNGDNTGSGDTGNQQPGDNTGTLQPDTDPNNPENSEGSENNPSTPSTPGTPSNPSDPNNPTDPDDDPDALKPGDGGDDPDL